MEKACGRTRAEPTFLIRFGVGSEYGAVRAACPQLVRTRIPLYLVVCMFCCDRKSVIILLRESLFLTFIIGWSKLGGAFGKIANDALREVPPPSTHYGPRDMLRLHPSGWLSGASAAFPGAFRYEIGAPCAPSSPPAPRVPLAQLDAYAFVGELSQSAQQQHETAATVAIILALLGGLIAALLAIHCFRSRHHPLPKPLPPLMMSKAASDGGARFAVR